MGALRVIVAAALVAAALPARAAADAPHWTLAQPDPPAGAPFVVGLGTPGDLTFWAPNRGLLGVEGNSVVPRGILAWDGVSWHQLAIVCGGPGDTMRIAWAGPDEFWTVSEPSRPRQGSGTALCHFKDGSVVGSYSTADNAADPYRQMNAAACNGPNDCWFGGVGASDPTGARVGAFHLHWDGTSLTTVYDAGSGRGVTDIAPSGDGFVESVVVGPRRDSEVAPDPPPIESKPLLLHRIDDHGNFSADPFVPATDNDGGSELLALGTAQGAPLWAVGGGAASGSAVAETNTDGSKKYPDGVIPRAPLAALLIGDQFKELPLTGDFGPEDRLEDVAPVAGTQTAWAAVVPYPERARTNVKAEVAEIDGGTGAATVQTLPASGSGRGAAARIAFVSATEGWMVTNAGWLFHYTDGSQDGQDTDPNFQNLITQRPNESAEQFVPDSVPADDSQLFAPPPVVVDPPPPAAPQKTLKALISKIRKPTLKGLTLTLRFTVARKAKVQLLARRGGKTVAKTKTYTFKKGRHSLRLKLSRKHWPTSLKFKTKELTIDTSDAGDTTTTTTTSTTTTSTPSSDTAVTSRVRG